VVTAAHLEMRDVGIGVKKYQTGLDSIIVYLKLAWEARHKLSLDPANTNEPSLGELPKALPFLSEAHFHTFCGLNPTA
jgi:hypothetical protein